MKKDEKIVLIIAICIFCFLLGAAIVQNQWLEKYPLTPEDYTYTESITK